MERKRTLTEENEVSSEKNKMLQRINKMGGVSMLPNQNQSSAFATPLPPHLTSLSDDDSINNEFIQNVVPTRSVKSTFFFASVFYKSFFLLKTPTPAPPVQFVPPVYHHHHHPPPQPLIQQPNLYSPQQTLHDYNSRPGSSMGGMGYPQVSMWPPSQYAQSTPNGKHIFIYMN